MDLAESLDIYDMKVQSFPNPHNIIMHMFIGHRPSFIEKSPTRPWFYCVVYLQISFNIYIYVTSRSLLFGKYLQFTHFLSS